jgi:hypothetical protein
MADGPLAEIIELMRRRSNAEEAAGRCEEADRAGYADLCRRHWHAHALSQQPEDKNKWWWTRSARRDSIRMCKFYYWHTAKAALPISLWLLLHGPRTISVRTH